MTVASVYAKLVTVVGGSSGIRTCPSEMPTVLNAADLPLAVVIPGEAEWNEHAVGLKRQVREWVVRVFVLPVAQGMGVDEGFRACLAPMNALGNTILDNITLDNTIDEVRQPFRDGGVRGDLTFGETTYHGFEFRLRITEKTT